METKQTSFKKALKKGELGELLVREYFESKGWIVYCPFTKNKAHYFDMLCTKNKKSVIALDVKTKARLNKWEAQGINIKSYGEYMGFVERIKIPFYLVFVDDKLGDVYAQNILKLTNRFKPNKDIIAWYLKDMEFLFNIGEENIEKISKLDQRSYKFKPLEQC